MNITKHLLWTSTVVAALSPLGCNINLSERSEPIYVQQQPQYVEAPPQYVYVQQAPPPPQVEYRPAPPSPTHVWIEGSWSWGNQRYNWEAGHYVVPPQPGAVWVGARFDNDPKGYRYTPGQWKKPNPGNGHDRDH